MNAISQAVPGPAAAKSLTYFRISAGCQVWFRKILTRELPFEGPSRGLPIVQLLVINAELLMLARNQRTRPSCRPIPNTAIQGDLVPWRDRKSVKHPHT